MNTTYPLPEEPSNGQGYLGGLNQSGLGGLHETGVGQAVHRYGDNFQHIDGRKLLDQMEHARNYYEILSVNPSASAEEIKTAYSRIYATLNQTAESVDALTAQRAREKIRFLDQLLPKLLDPKQREQYNQTLAKASIGNLQLGIHSAADLVDLVQMAPESWEDALQACSNGNMDGWLRYGVADAIARKRFLEIVGQCNNDWSFTLHRFYWWLVMEHAPLRTLNCKPLLVLGSGRYASSAQEISVLADSTAQEAVYLLRSPGGSILVEWLQQVDGIIARNVADLIRNSRSSSRILLEQVIHVLNPMLPHPQPLLAMGLEGEFQPTGALNLGPLDRTRQPFYRLLKIARQGRGYFYGTLRSTNTQRPVRLGYADGSVRGLDSIAIEGDTVLMIEIDSSKLSYNSRYNDFKLLLETPSGNYPFSISVQIVPEKYSPNYAIKRWGLTFGWANLVIGMVLAVIVGVSAAIFDMVNYKWLEIPGSLLFGLLAYTLFSIGNMATLAIPTWLGFLFPMIVVGVATASLNTAVHPHYSYYTYSPGAFSLVAVIVCYLTLGIIKGIGLAASNKLRDKLYKNNPPDEWRSITNFSYIDPETQEAQKMIEEYCSKNLANVRTELQDKIRKNGDSIRASIVGVETPPEAIAQPLSATSNPACNYYELIEAERDASEHFIRQRIAHTRQQLQEQQTSPFPQDQDDANRKLAYLQEAERILLDPALRADYNKQLPTSTPPPATPLPEVASLPQQYNIKARAPFEFTAPPEQASTLGDFIAAVDRCHWNEIPHHLSSGELARWFEYGLRNERLKQQAIMSSKSLQQNQYIGSDAHMNKLYQNEVVEIFLRNCDTNLPTSSIQAKLNYQSTIRTGDIITGTLTLLNMGRDGNGQGGYTTVTVQNPGQEGFSFSTILAPTASFGGQTLNYSFSLQTTIWERVFITSGYVRSLRPPGHQIIPIQIQLSGQPPMTVPIAFEVIPRSILASFFLGIGILLLWCITLPLDLVLGIFMLIAAILRG